MNEAPKSSTTGEPSDPQTEVGNEKLPPVAKSSDPPPRAPNLETRARGSDRRGAPKRDQAGQASPNQGPPERSVDDWLAIFDYPLPGASQKDRWSRWTREVGVWVGMVAIALLLNAVVVQLFAIPSPSMTPTLDIGDRVVVEKVSYDFGSPRRGDVIVFEEPTEGSQNPGVIARLVARILGRSTEGRYLCKRVAAVAGDDVRITAQGIYVNDVLLQDGSAGIPGGDIHEKRMTIPDGRVYVLGDNAAQSRDSRYFGTISEESIVGRAVLVVWPPRAITTL